MTIPLEDDRTFLPLDANTLVTPSVLTRVFRAVQAERQRAEAKHGQQSLPLGTGRPADQVHADLARAACDLAAATGDVTWRHIIAEEVYEAFAESDPAAFVTEAVQAIGTLFAAIENTVADHPDLSLV